MPWGLVIAKTFCGVDPRLDGSRNTGATNVARLCGFGWGVATLACDVLKGALPVWLALRVNPAPLFVSAVALACVLGHVFSCFMRFRGGKAVATSIGVFLPLAFWPLLDATAHALKFSGFQDMYFSDSFPPAYGVTPDKSLANRPELLLPEAERQDCSLEDFTRKGAAAVVRRLGLQKKG